METDEKTDTVQIGYCIGRKWWNKGYTSEAFPNIIPFLFRDVKDSKIEARYDPDNPASGKVTKKMRLAIGRRSEQV